ncbi:MAG: hypothetical protein Q4D90_02485 [bacterium]|nr:hypothetical protein [bacterium]
MAFERVPMYRNAGTANAPKWEKWFQQTAADAVYIAEANGDLTDKTIVDYVQEKINDLIGGAPETYDTLKEIADYIAAHKEVADALNAAITQKADKNHTHATATTSADGFMAAADKAKLGTIAEGATANDTLYKNQTPSTVALGGIPKGYVPPAAGVEAIDMIDKLLHAYVGPTVTAAMTPANGGVVEVGTSHSVTGVTVNITLGSAAITKIEVFDGSTSLATKTSGITAGANAITFDAALTVTATKQLSVTVTDADGKTVTAKTGTYNFVNAYYYGAVAADVVAPTTAQVKALTKSVTAKSNKSFTYNCTDQKMVFAYPASYGALAKILDPNNFDVTDTFTRNDVTVDGVAYYVYINSASTVSAFKMTFNY